MPLKTQSLKVAGMVCSKCANSVENAVNAVEGVNGAKVDLIKNTVEFNLDNQNITQEIIKTAIEEAGFDAS